MTTPRKRSVSEPLAKVDRTSPSTVAAGNTTTAPSKPGGLSHLPPPPSSSSSTASSSTLPTTAKPTPKIPKAGRGAQRRWVPPSFPKAAAPPKPVPATPPPRPVIPAALPGPPAAPAAAREKAEGCHKCRGSPRAADFGQLRGHAVQDLALRQLQDGCNCRLKNTTNVTSSRCAS